MEKFRGGFPLWSGTNDSSLVGWNFKDYIFVIFGFSTLHWDLVSLFLSFNLIQIHTHISCRILKRKSLVHDSNYSLHKKTLLDLILNIAGLCPDSNPDMGFFFYGGNRSLNFLPFLFMGQN